MKRPNPTTNEPFKRGHVRDDGFVFFAYTKISKSDGFFKEIWLNPLSSDKIKDKDKAAKKANYKRRTERHAPGFDKLSPKIQATVNQLRRVHDEQTQHGDLTEDEMVEMLIGYELDPAELNIAIEHAQPLCFDAKTVFSKVFTI
jgi:hypothetical protein